MSSVERGVAGFTGAGPRVRFVGDFSQQFRQNSRTRLTGSIGAYGDAEEQTSSSRNRLKRRRAIARSLGESELNALDRCVRGVE